MNSPGKLDRYTCINHTVMHNNFTLAYHTKYKITVAIVGNFTSYKLRDQATHPAIQAREGNGHDIKTVWE